MPETLGYILGDQQRPSELKKSKAKLDALIAELTKDISLDEEEHEEEQRDWIRVYEKGLLGEERQFVDRDGNTKKGTTWKEVYLRLNHRLRPPQRAIPPLGKTE